LISLHMVFILFGTVAVEHSGRRRQRFTRRFGIAVLEQLGHGQRY
jgi:hypothetical protein